MEYISGKDTVTTVKMPTKGLKYYLSLVDKAEKGLKQGLIPIFKKVLHVKMLSNSIACYITEKSVQQKEESTDAANFIAVLL